MKITNKFQAVSQINSLDDMKGIAKNAEKIVGNPNNRAHPFLNSLRAILADYRSSLASLRACTNFTLECDIGTSKHAGLTVQAIMERLEKHKMDFKIASVHADPAAASSAIAERLNKEATHSSKTAVAVAKPARTRKPRGSKANTATAATAAA